MSDPPDEKPDMQPVMIRVPREWHDALRRLSYEERKDISQIVRDALAARYDLPPCPPMKRGVKPKK